MKTQVKNFGLKKLLKTTTLAGWTLLARPVIYLLFSRRRDLDAYATVDTSAIIFIVYSFFAFYIGSRKIFHTKEKIGKSILFKSPIIWFLFYSFLGVVSMLWSVNPMLSGFRAFECIAMMLLIVAVIKELFSTGDLRYVVLWSIFYCTWDIAFALIRTLKWTTNLSILLESSQMMATTFFFMALYFTPRKWYNYLIMVMSIFSMSTVAYIGMALGAISAFWTKGNAKFITIIVAIALLLTTLWMGPKNFLKQTIFFDKAEISLEETSGRDKLMNATISCVEKNPFGLGFFAAEPFVLYSSHLGAISAHNSLFSAGMGMGFPGIILLSIFFISMGVCVFSRSIPKPYRPSLIGCFCVAFLHCMGNPSVGTRVFGAWMPCMYVFVLICYFNAFGRFYENTLSPTRTIS